jgi:hypothetical protein
MPIEVVQQDHLNSSIGRGVAVYTLSRHGVHKRVIFNEFLRKKSLSEK